MYSRRAPAEVFIMLALGLACLWPARAADLRFEPATILLTPTARVADVRLRNDGPVSMQVQVRAFRWEQTDGEDRLSATDSLGASPRIQELAPGQEQIVRVLLAEDMTAEQEETFRLIVDELPGAAAADRRVQTLIRYSIPVVVQPGALPPADLRFRIGTSEGQTVLEAHNGGGQNARLSELRLQTSSGAAIDANSGLDGYVLAGRMRRWPIALPDGMRTGSITAISADVNGEARSYAPEVVN